jgi:ABC-type antimicrobial peptide transport system permease subunit
MLTRASTRLRNHCNDRCWCLNFPLNESSAGAAGGYALVRVAEGVFGNVQLTGALPVIGAAVLIGAAVAASLIPATRASRVDVLRALRSE